MKAQMRCRRSLKRWRAGGALFCALAAAFFFGSDARGQGLDVAIVASASQNGISDCRMTDPQTQLLASGFFDSVDLIDTFVTTPTLAELSAYDAILCWSNVTPLDNVAWGDVLADYIDAGGGVVVALFANTSTDPARILGGRWHPGYEIVPPLSGGSVGGTSTLGTIEDPTHPILEGVTSFAGGTSSFRPFPLDGVPGSIVVARWADGRLLVAVDPNQPRRVDLGFYPPSSLCSPGLHDVATDGDLLLTNSLRFVGGAEPSTEFVRGDCTDDGQVGIADAISLLTYLFVPGAAISPPECFDAWDADDTGQLDIADAIGLLGWLFGGTPLPGPNQCGVDPTDDDPLDCASFVQCP